MTARAILLIFCCARTARPGGKLGRQRAFDHRRDRATPAASASPGADRRPVGGCGLARLDCELGRRPRAAPARHRRLAFRQYSLCGHRLRSRPRLQADRQGRLHHQCHRPRAGRAGQSLRDETATGRSPDISFILSATCTSRCTPSTATTRAAIKSRSPSSTRRCRCTRCGISALSRSAPTTGVNMSRSSKIIGLQARTFARCNDGTSRRLGAPGARRRRRCCLRVAGRPEARRRLLPAQPADGRPATGARRNSPGAFTQRSVRPRRLRRRAGLAARTHVSALFHRAMASGKPAKSLGTRRRSAGAAPVRFARLTPSGTACRSR